MSIPLSPLNLTPFQDDDSEEGESDSENEGETSDSVKAEDESNQTEDKPEVEFISIYTCLSLYSEKTTGSLLYLSRYRKARFVPLQMRSMPYSCP